MPVLSGELMKIFEVTRVPTVQEAAPGSFAAKAGVFARAAGNALSRQVFGVSPAEKAGTSVPIAGRESAATLATQPAVKQLANQTLASYNQEMLMLMGQEKIPGSGAIGVQSVSMVPEAKRLAIINKIVNGLLVGLSNGSVRGINSVDELIQGLKEVPEGGTIDPTRERAALFTKSAKDSIQKITNMLVRNPETMATAKTFQNLLANIYYIANQSIFHDKDEKTPGAEPAKTAAPTSGAEAITVDRSAGKIYVGQQEINLRNPVSINALTQAGATVK